MYPCRDFPNTKFLTCEHAESTLTRDAESGLSPEPCISTSS
uniref:Uncharacterized protein n=1 Tax=Rhizophora mucronata TaxID=61149 RepID=A0A2P2NGR0_RHIMU